MNEPLSSLRRSELNFVKDPKNIQKFSLWFQIFFFCCLDLLLGYFNIFDCNTLFIRSQLQQNTIKSNSLIGRAWQKDSGSLICEKCIDGSRRNHYIDKSEFEVISFYDDTSNAQKSIKKDGISVATYTRIVIFTTVVFEYLLDFASS